MKRISVIVCLASTVVMALAPTAHSELNVQIGRDNLDLQLGLAQAILGLQFVVLSDVGSPMVEQIRSDPDGFNLRAISKKLESTPTDYSLRTARSILALRALRSIPVGDDHSKRREHDLKLVDEEWASLAAIRPDDPVPVYYRGLVAFELTENAAAITHLEKAQRLGQSDLRVLRLLAYLYLMTGDWDQSLAASSRGVEEHDDPFLRRLQPIVLVALERYGDALRVCEVILGLGKDRETSLLYATIHMIIDRPGKAVEVLEEMRTTKPDDKEVLSLLLQAYRMQSDSDEIRSLEGLLRRNYPDDPKIQELLDASIPNEARP